MITVHYLNDSRAHRLVWLLEELALPYKIKLYQRDANFLAPPELKAIHPLGKSPVIEDDGVVLAESGAIFEYLLARHGAGQLVPATDSPAWVDYLYFMHSAEGSAMPLLVNKLVFGEVKRRSPWIVRPIAGAIADRLNAMLVDRTLPEMLNFWETKLTASDWFAVDFSAADIMMSFPVQAAANRADAKNGRPRLADWLTRIESRPAYKRAAERGEFKVL